VYSPALMLQAGDPMAAQLGFYGAVALATFKALAAIGLFRHRRDRFSVHAAIMA